MDGVEYYGITHAHPNANSCYTTESLMHLMAFDVDDRMDLIDQPLLMMAGDIADTKYMTDSAFQKAVNAKRKELFLIESATHIRTYWVPEYVEQTTKKLATFLSENL
ncbi:MAG: alpha/beta hydrolase [Clostridia bacterium]|nr:alpha/beta hydrolase [Clostridia bacterium]